MPGNEVGDRVHNFFAQDNLSRGQHNSLVVDGNWPVLNNNLWGGQIGVPSSNSKNYNLQQADLERDHSSDSLHAPHGLNTKQSTLRPEFAKSQSQSQQQNLNGSMYGCQVFQTRQDEANFLGVDTESDRHNLTPRGSSIYESQQGSGPEHHTKTSVRLESSESPVSFDLFGAQQQMSGQLPGMLQSLPQQQSRFNDIQHLHQEVMFRKMHELQRQQLDAGRQNSVNQIPSFARQSSGNHFPTLINGTPVSDASNYPRVTEFTAGSMNWLQRASPDMQGSSSGFVFSSEQGQAPRSMGLVPQQVDQSLYGVPISSSRGSLNQYSLIATDKPLEQQMSMYRNSFPGNYAIFPEEANMQDVTSLNRQGFQGKISFGHASGHDQNSRINMENLQQLNPLQRNAAVQDFQRRQELVGPSKILQEKTAMQAASSQNAVALDPTEEKILFGSDDNSWDAFGRSTNRSGGASNLLGGTGFSNGPSVQSGSWSALMQSAVAETSGSDIGVQEEWSGLDFQNPELSTGNHQPSTFNDGGKQQTALANDNLQIASASSFGSVPLSDDANMNNNYHGGLGFQQFGQISYEPGDRLQIHSSQMHINQSSGGSNWLNRSPLQKQLAEGRQIYGNASHSLDAKMTAKSISGHWTQQSGSTQPLSKPNNWNSIELVSPSGDVALNIQENENSLQHSQKNDQKSIMHEEMGHDDGIWRVNSIPNSTVEFEPIKSTMGSPQANREGYSLNNAVAVPNSSTTRVGEETSQLLPNSHHLNYWKHVDSLVKSKGSDDTGKSLHHLKGPQVLESSFNSSDKEEVKMREIEKCNIKENSNDSHRSNLSHHTSTGGLRKNFCTDASDSQTLPRGKQKSSYQVGRKTSGSCKFQYHPMGNLDDDVEPSNGIRQATNSQAMLQQSSRGLKSYNQGNFGHSKLFGQVPNNSTEIGKVQLPDLQGDAKGFDVASSRGIHPGYVPSTGTSAPLDRYVGFHAPNKASQSSQNMLELLHKVDQSRENGNLTPLSSSEPNPSSDMPEAENSDGSVGLLQRSHSSASQGFGLQLAPPLQRLPVPNHVSQSSAQAVNSIISTQTTPEMRDKGHTQLGTPASIQSLPPSHGTSQGEFKNNRIDIPGQTGGEASLYKMQGNFSPAFNSGFPYSRSQLQNQYRTGAGGATLTNQSVNAFLDRHASYSKQADNSGSRPLTGQSAQASLPDAACNIPYDNPASSGDTSQPTGSHNPRERVPTPYFSVGEAVSVSQPFNTSGISQQGAFSKVLPNIWTNVPAQQQFLGAQARKVPSYFAESYLSHQSNVVESTFSAPQNLEDHETNKRGIVSSEFGASSVNSQGFVCVEERPLKESPCQQVSPGNIDMVQKINASQGKEPIINHLSDAPPENPALTRRDIEVFGRSLKPNNVFHQNHSLLNQMQAMMNSETDPTNRGLKRFKGPDNILGGQQVAPKAGQSNECNTIVGDALVRHTTVPSGNSTMLSFSGPADNLERNASSQLGNVPSEDMLAFYQNGSQNYSCSNKAASMRVEHTQISPKMAPSWFNEYGTFKNGQMLPIWDARKAATVKTAEQTFTLGKSSISLHTLDSMGQVNAAADAGRGCNMQKSSTHTSVAIEHFPPPNLLPPDVGGQNFVVLKPMKRKSAPSELHPWHKEVSQSHGLQTISMAEIDWAKSVNRLSEKGEDDAYPIEDGIPMHRPKRRLILATQLMQQLLRPPSAAILSADASSSYESVAYFIARLALGDACSLISCSSSYSNMPRNGATCLYDNCKTAERINDRHLSEVMEDFMGRARQLENDLMRLDKKASVLDLRVECQDLEKFSVINRFAKFHGRGQADGAEISSSFDAAANAQKPCPQRYVTALPLPRNLPDGVQCLSL